MNVRLPFAPALVLVPFVLAAQTASAAMYTCIEAGGRKVSSGQEMPDCKGEQRLYSSTGGYTVVPPTVTRAQQASEIEAGRVAGIEAAKANEIARANAQLVRAFPDDAALRAKRDADLEGVRKLMAQPEARRAEILAQRKPLTEQAAFYDGKPMPRSLKALIDSNDAALAATQTMMNGLKTREAGIRSRYDEQLAQLKPLWAAQR